MVRFVGAHRSAPFHWDPILLIYRGLKMRWHCNYMKLKIEHPSRFDPNLMERLGRTAVRPYTPIFAHA